MSEIRGLTEQILETLVEQTRDDAPTLADLAARIEPTAGELIDAWASANRDAAEGQAIEGVLAPDRLRDWVVSLRQRNLSQYFSLAVEWTRDLIVLALPYDRAVSLLREYQRRAIPFLMRVYPAGPELETALNAFDDLFEATVALIGAVYVESFQENILVDARAQVLGQVFGGATHALNNLLAVVLGRMTVLIERTRIAEERAELLDIQEAVAEGAQMVRRLQEFTRNDRVIQPVAVDANLLLRDAAEITRFIWRDQAETAGVVLDVVKDFADVPPVLARPAALREIFVIMIANAIKALPQGGLITLRTERQDDRVFASVIHRDLALEPPRATTTTPSFASNRLALSAAAKIAAEFGGALTSESTPERGTLLTLSLPLAHGGMKEKPTMTTQPADVLFIDNEPAVRDAFTRLLALYGHRVTTAESGEKGVAAFQAGKFDVVFTDLGMPGMSGWEVARAIKKISPAALVVLVTGWPIDLSAQKSKETGVDRVVTKPLDMPQVLSLLDDAVAMRGRT